MAKNVTISIPEELNKKMDQLEEVNWSAVARKAIEEYLETRTHPELESIIQRLSKEKKEEYGKGVKIATSIATTASYTDLNQIFVRYDFEYDQRVTKKNDKMRERVERLEQQNQMFGFGGGFPHVILDDEDRFSMLANIVYDEGLMKRKAHTTEFNRGLFETLFEFKEKLKV